MTHSIELLNKALEIKTISEWARTLNIVPSTITNARRIGRLSPTLAGNFAINLGENPTQWIALAAMEAEPESAHKKQLLSRVTSLYLSLGELVGFFQQRRRTSDFFRHDRRASDLLN